MTLRRSVLAALCVVAAAPASASAATPSRAAFELSSAGKRALRPLAVTSVPKGPAKQPSFAIGAWSVSSSARIALTGSWRFTAGKRRVSVSRLQVTIGRTSSYVSGRIGKTSSAPVRAHADTALGHRRPGQARLDGRRALRAHLRRREAAARPRSGSSARRREPRSAGSPSASPISRRPCRRRRRPPPRPPADARTDPDARPGDTLRERFAATPAGSVDWFGCDLPANGDLKSWTSYVQRALPGPCDGPLGSVTASGGAARIVERHGPPLPAHRERVRRRRVRDDHHAGDDHVLDADPRHRGVDRRPEDRDRGRRTDRHAYTRPARRSRS